MIRIGLFSKMNRVTVKALRYYDEVGLLKPCKVDTWTNYRYYSADQIPQLHQILSLKQIGFSINEIKEIVSKKLSDDQLIEFLRKKREETERAALEEQRKVQGLDAYINLLQQEKKMEQNVIIKELPEVIVASIRQVIPDYNALFTLAPKMGELMEKRGDRCAKPDYCFNVYHDGEYKEKDIDVEICQAVEKMNDDADGVVYKQLEAVPTAACIMHKGVYQLLGKSYELIMKWIEANGYEIVGNPRESYIDGIWNKEDESEWLTEIQIPVKKK